MSNFAFLLAEWPAVQDPAAKAEALALADPRAACFHARRALELAVVWLYQHDDKLTLPYQDHLGALLYEPSFRECLGQTVWNKASLINRLGNQAVQSHKKMRPDDALVALRELFHVCYWLAHTYAIGGQPPDGLAFDAALLPAASSKPLTLPQLQSLAKKITEKDVRLSVLLGDKEGPDAELARLRAQIAKAKAKNAARPDRHDYSEAQTRDFFIDLLLKEAGWPLDQKRDREYPVSGMPNKTGQGFVDYVLWGEDGKPLAVVEAKKTRRDARVGQHQAKLYADCLETQFGRRPVIFYTNGYQHWLWDDTRYPPRSVQGYYTRDELELLIQRRATRTPLGDTEVNAAIVNRFYQTRAIRRIGESFEKQQRKALLVMATGAGKTRTAVALCDLLMRCNWVKRVLFLADRVALVKQAVGAFKQHLPSSSPVNLVTDRDTEGRVYVSTYPTMMGLINEVDDGLRKFGVGFFDLIIIDEAHRSVYQKYRAIFEYFDSLLIGLTATPRDEVDRNTYGLFELEAGMPTDCYELDEAVKDGVLVPPRAVSVPMRFQREGIRYDQLSDAEKEEWDEKEWAEDGQVPDHVEAAAVNKWLFNEDTVDKVLMHLMTRGQKVAGGERLGKTIIFAANRNHAYYIAERFDANYPHLKGAFAQVIEYDISYAQKLIDDFSAVEKMPHIAISIDMLDTGIDVPEVVNLVFFKMVRSLTKFRQMIGRGTRLRPDLFGPGDHKKFFFIFDSCQNLEFFQKDPETTEGALGAPLGKRLFTARLELIDALDRKLGSAPGAAAEQRPRYGTGKTAFGEVEVREETAALLCEQVGAMNVNNFIVRPHREAVEKYAQPVAWKELGKDNLSELTREVAGLPSELPEDDEEAKRFDLLMLRLQLALLHGEPGFERLREQVRTIVGLLEEQGAIPVVRAEMALIQELQTDEYWQDVTAPLLEMARKRIRLLIKLIEKVKRQPVYTDFEDEMGDEAVIELPGLGSGAGFERFRARAQQFLKAHKDHVAIVKLRWNRPLTSTDLGELGRMLLEAGVGTNEDLARAEAESRGLGLFIRSILGLDREAAKQAFGRFLSDLTSTANQIEFINLIIDHLSEHGTMDPARLYESPFTDKSPRGPVGLFTSAQVNGLIAVLEEVRERAAG